MTKNKLKIPDYIRNSQIFKETLARLEAETDDVLGVIPKKVELTTNPNDTLIWGFTGIVISVPITIISLAMGFLGLACTSFVFIGVCGCAMLIAAIAIEKARDKAQFEKYQRILNDPPDVKNPYAGYTPDQLPIKLTLKEESDKSFRSYTDNKIRDVYEHRKEFPPVMRESISQTYHDRFGDPRDPYIPEFDDPQTGIIHCPYQPAFGSKLSKTIYEQELAAHNNEI